MSSIQVDFESRNAPLAEGEIEKFANLHLATRKAKDVSAEIKIVGKKRIHALNLEFMKRDYPTDVLSFPLPKIPGEKENNLQHIGTIILCSDIIKLNAGEDGRSEREEFIFVLKHGLDHLLGIHHN